MYSLMYTVSGSTCHTSVIATILERWAVITVKSSSILLPSEVTLDSKNSWEVIT